MTTTPLRLINEEVIWPYSVAQLRLDEPTYSFTRNPKPARLAYFNVIFPQPTSPPSVDVATHRVVEARPQFVDGEWIQSWEVQELSETEKKAIWREANPPQWQAFGQAVWSNPAIGQMLRGGLQMDQTTPVSLALPVGLGQAAQDESYDTFLNAARAAYHAGLLAVPLLAGIASLAVQYLLPEEFISGIRSILAVMPMAFSPTESPARFDEWTAPDGSVWVFDQPRDAQGQYVVDDPETEVVESALRWQLVLEVPE